MDGTLSPTPASSRRLGQRSPRLPRLDDLLGILLVCVGAFASVATNLADDPEADTSGLSACTAAADCAEKPETPYCLETYQVCVECLDDAHCDAQSRCFEHRCRASCVANDGCAGDLVCLDGLCRSCSADTDCGDPGSYCYIGPDTNACRPLCSSSAECTGPGYVAGDVCRAGQCQQVTCESALDCLLDRELCDPSDGLCKPIL